MNNIRDCIRVALDACQEDIRNIKFIPELVYMRIRDDSKYVEELYDIEKALEDDGIDHQCMPYADSYEIQIFSFYNVTFKFDYITKERRLFFTESGKIICKFCPEDNVNIEKLIEEIDKYKDKNVITLTRSDGGNFRFYKNRLMSISQNYNNGIQQNTSVKIYNPTIGGTSEITVKESAKQIRKIVNQKS